MVTEDNLINNQDDSEIQMNRMRPDSSCNRNVYEGGDDTALELLKNAGEDAAQANLEMGATSDVTATQPGEGEQKHYDPVKFMSQVPPNWEKAELHGMANLVLDSSKTKLNPDDKDSYCPCCQLPYPQEEDFYDITVDNGELGMLGSGFPLFFVLMQMLIFYCLCISLIVTVPAGLRINQAIKELEA